MEPILLFVAAVGSFACAIAVVRLRVPIARESAPSFLSLLCGLVLLPLVRRFLRSNVRATLGSSTRTMTQRACRGKFCSALFHARGDALWPGAELRVASASLACFSRSLPPACSRSPCPPPVGCLRRRNGGSGQALWSKQQSGGRRAAREQRTHKHRKGERTRTKEGGRKGKRIGRTALAWLSALRRSILSLLPFLQEKRTALHHDAE